jgi:nucleotide-binding universal stress UspA family protein
LQTVWFAEWNTLRSRHGRRLATDEQVGLIVIGQRRRSPVGKLILGSPSRRILPEADVPVLTVKA